MTLRAKLFLSVGSILLIVAILSFLLPEIWIKKDITKASSFLNVKIKELEDKLLKTSAFLISYRLLQTKAELEASLQMISAARVEVKNKGHGFVLASKIAVYNPDIAFVEVTNGESHIVLVEDATLYTPLWAPNQKDKLWVKIPEKNRVYEAHLIPDSSIDYLMFLSQSYPKDLVFRSDDSATSSSATLFDSLLKSQSEWVDKMDLIRLLSPWQEKENPDGIFQIDKGRPFAVLSNEVFSREKFSEISSDAPTYFLRKASYGKSLDLAQSIQFSEQPLVKISIGFSFSQIVSKVAKILKKPILIFLDEDLVLAFSETGDEIPISDVKLIQDQFTIDGKKYIYSKIPVDNAMTLKVLGGEAEANAVEQFLAKLKEELITKISLNLIGAALLIFLVALFLLGRISKKITEPIAKLAKASQKIGEGKYEDLSLPKADKRKDEVAVLVHSFENMVLSLKEREKIRSLLNKVVSKEIAAEILKGTIELKGEERSLTMLFSDIRGFTRISENLKPHILIGMLNDYMTEMCRIVDETQGVVDKFVGDEIMALYGAPLHFEGHTVRAIDAACSMMDALRNWNEKQKAINQPPFEIGIGIHTGIVYAGNMGAENRLNYTVVGANVNLASRICGVAKPMQILISEAAFQAPGVQEKYQFKKMESVTLKGIDHPVTLYEISTNPGGI